MILNLFLLILDIIFFLLAVRPFRSKRVKANWSDPFLPTTRSGYLTVHASLIAKTCDMFPGYLRQTKSHQHQQSQNLLINEALITTQSQLLHPLHDHICHRIHYGPTTRALHSLHNPLHPENRKAVHTLQYQPPPPSPHFRRPKTLLRFCFAARLTHRHRLLSSSCPAAKQILVQEHSQQPRAHRIEACGLRNISPCYSRRAR